VGRGRLVLLALVAVLAAAVAVAAVSRRDHSAPTKPSAPATSQKVGDSADVMRRLQRKHLVRPDR
jgi:hypothetical protein